MVSKMQIDNKEFLAVKASDVARVRIKLLDLIDADIECYRKKKLAKTKELNDKELKKLENQGVCDECAPKGSANIFCGFFSVSEGFR